MPKKRCQNALVFSRKMQLLYGRGGGEDFVSRMARCVLGSKDNWSFFGIEGNEMNEKFSFKMGVKFAASLNMGGNFLDILYKVMYRNAWTELQ